MGLTTAQSYLGDILHVISQGLLIPTIILLLLLILYALFCIGSILVEYFTERRNFKVFMPRFLAALMSAKQDNIPTVIQNSGLLNRQKIALLTVFDYRTLPGDALVATIRRIVNEEEEHYERTTARNNMAARVSPMIGLMGTLIPLGPGIQALGNADTSALSSSLLIAFDTTVAGLIVAAICLVIGKVRGIWYSGYMSALDAAMATMLEKIETMRSAGEITVEEPTDYAFLFETSIGKGSQARVSKTHAELAEAASEEQRNASVPGASMRGSYTVSNDSSYGSSYGNSSSRGIASSSVTSPYSRYASDDPYSFGEYSSFADGMGDEHASTHRKDVSLPSIDTGARENQCVTNEASTQSQRGRHADSSHVRY